MASCPIQNDPAGKRRRTRSLTLGGTLLLTCGAACNALWGVDDLSYTIEGAAGTGGAAGGSGTGTTTTSCEAECSGKCAGADDGCGDVCAEHSCAATDCCDEQLACVTGQEDSRCGAAGASCVDCTATNRTCAPVGSSFAAQTRGCLPPCAGHLRFVSVTSGDLGGVQGASDFCSIAAGAGWHLVTQLDQAREPAQDGVLQWTGGPIVGLCDGDWCADIDWGTGASLNRQSVLSASSCSDLSSAAAGQSADGIYRDANGCGQWQSDPNGIDCAMPHGSLSGSAPGILCTDL